MRKLIEKIFPPSKGLKEYKRLSNLYNYLIGEAFNYIRSDMNKDIQNGNQINFMEAYTKYSDRINYVVAMGSYNGISLSEKTYTLKKQISYIERHMYDIPAIRAELREVKLTELTKEE